MNIAEGEIRTSTIQKIGVPSPLGSGGLITLGSNETAGSLILTASGNMATDRPLSIGPAGGILKHENRGSLELSGAVEGTGSLGLLSGKVRMDGDKSFSGPIAAEGAVLDLNGSIPSAITILRGSTLKTSGTSPRTIGALTVQDGSLSLGGSGVTASLNTGDLTIGGGVSHFDFQEAANGYDFLDVTGSVLLIGRTFLTIRLGVDPEDYVDVYRLIRNDESDATTLFDENARFVYQGQVLEDGQLFLVSDGAYSQYFQMDYGLTPEDNDVRFVAVPEPGTTTFLLGATAALLGFRRRGRA